MPQCAAPFWDSFSCHLPPTYIVMNTEATGATFYCFKHAPFRGLTNTMTLRRVVIYDRAIYWAQAGVIVVTEEFTDNLWSFFTVHTLRPMQIVRYVPQFIIDELNRPIDVWP